LSNFRSANDKESKTAYFRNHAPWVAPLAYVHIIFKPCPKDVLSAAARRMKMPTALFEFLARQNGAILFSDAVRIHGVHRPGQLLHRDDSFSVLPYDIEIPNRDWPPVDRARFLAFGGYGYDGSTVCIDRNDSQIYLFERGRRMLVREPSLSWSSIDEWLSSEISRSSVLFDERGKRLVDESQTLPHSAPSS